MKANTTPICSNLCAGMVPDICKRLNNWVDCAEHAENAREFSTLREKAKHEFSHLCHCIKKITTAQARELMPLFAESSQRYKNICGWDL